MQVESAPTGGKPTLETCLLVCQCKSTRFTEHKRTKTAIVFKCRECGLSTSVKGNVTYARVSQDEVSFAVEKKMITPGKVEQIAMNTGENEGSVEEETEKKPTLSEQGYRQLRFRVLKESDDVIQDAFEGVRIQNAGVEEFRSQQWQGLALEAVCADYLSGLDPMVRQVIDAQKEAVAIANAKHEQKTGRTITKRKASRIKNRVRDEMAAQLGFLEKPEPLEKAPTSDEETLNAIAAQSDEARQKAEEEEADQRHGDDERLIKAIRDARDAAREPEQIRVGDERHYAEFVNYYNTEGGVLLKILGDERTKDAAGKQPKGYMLLTEGFSIEDGIDIYTCYLDRIDDILPDPELRVIELLPSDWNTYSEEDRWDMPEIADGREVVDGL